MNLETVAIEIREILENKRTEYGLSFEEDNHIYTMNDLNGIPKIDFPSVSTIIKYFHDEFDSETKSFKKARGNKKVQEKLLLEWKLSGDYATNIGSRTHYNLEKYIIGLYGNYKDVRQPIFECDETQSFISEKMIKAGKDFIDVMHKRGAILLDTEIVLGSPYIGYTGQPDKVWLYFDGKDLGIIITDWKTNKPKNFEIHHYTNNMYEPFEFLPNNSLGHYNLQLPLYVKLIFDMLKGSKYENIKLFGCIIVLLKDDSTFQEFRIPKSVYNKVLKMDVLEYINNKKNI